MVKSDILCKSNDAPLMSLPATLIQFEIKFVVSHYFALKGA